MSGRRIDDHSSWIGSGSKESVFAKGAKVKLETSAEGAGELSKYEDTTEAIKATQVVTKNKTKQYTTKPGYRN